MCRRSGRRHLLGPREWAADRVDGLVARYRDDDPVAAWADLCAVIGPAPSQALEPEAAEAFARTAMAILEIACDRIRTNIELIQEQIEAHGFDPVGADGPCGPDDVEMMERTEELAGDLPATLTSYWMHVGPVNLQSRRFVHERRPPPMRNDLPPADLIAADPLWIYGPDAALEEAEWWADEGHVDSDVCRVPISPDRLHKMNVAEGEPYTIVLPSVSIDGIIEGTDRGPIPLMEHLRHVILAGRGFPALVADSPWHAVLDELDEQLVPF